MNCNEIGKVYSSTNKRNLAVYISLALLAGCINIDDPKNYQPSMSTSDKGRIYLYRIAPRSTPGSWQDWVLDGHWNGEIRPGRAYCHNSHVGRHIVRVGISDKKVEFTLVKGQEVFVRFDVEPNIHPVIVDRELAIKDLKTFGADTDHAECSSE